jgi:CheY-like chemotaxis protein
MITCLLVEQNEDLIYLVRRYGEQAGLQIIIATGPEAVVQARALQPVVILLESDASAWNGWEVLHALKIDQDTHHIPVVMYTALDQRARILAEGADECLQMPFLYEEFLAALEAVGVKRSSPPP